MSRDQSPSEKNHILMEKEHSKSLSMDRLVVLPFKKSLEIAFAGIKVRFFRSLITTMSLVLAVSFLGFTNVSNDIANGLLNSNRPENIEALNRHGYDVTSETRSVSTSPKQRWIVVLSLLVCVVGIVNAQLMAVTERFREIGTMKCLGALDGFVLRLFMLEAGIQGIAGAGAGSIIGGFAALVSGLLGFGLEGLYNLSLKDFLFSIFSATIIGCVLSLIGVLYPAMVAAKMQPVEAMRVEQ